MLIDYPGLDRIEQGQWNYTTHSSSSLYDFNYDRYIVGGALDLPLISAQFFFTRTTPLYASSLISNTDSLLNAGSKNVRLGLLSSNGSQIRSPAVYTLCNNAEYW